MGNINSAGIWYINQVGKHYRSTMLKESCFREKFKRKRKALKLSSLVLFCFFCVFVSLFVSKFICCMIDEPIRRDKSMLQFGHRAQSSWRDGKHQVKQEARKYGLRNNPAEPNFLYVFK